MVLSRNYSHANPHTKINITVLYLTCNSYLFLSRLSHHIKKPPFHKAKVDDNMIFVMVLADTIKCNL